MVCCSNATNSLFLQTFSRFLKNMCFSICCMPLKHFLETLIGCVFFFLIFHELRVVWLRRQSVELLKLPCQMCFFYFYLTNEIFQRPRPRRNPQRRNSTKPRGSKRNLRLEATRTDLQRCENSEFHSPSPVLMELCLLRTISTFFLTCGGRGTSFSNSCKGTNVLAQPQKPQRLQLTGYVG